MEKILILAGGCDSERAVSAASGKRVAEALCSLGIKTALIDPAEDADLLAEHFFLSFNEMKKSTAFFKKWKNDSLHPDTHSSDPGPPSSKKTSLNKQSPICFNTASSSETTAPAVSRLITDSSLELCKAADAVFIMLHGKTGESGRLQALFESLGIKYFGSCPEGSADAMDKLRTKRIFESVGIPTPLYTVYRAGQPLPPLPPCYPCVVKPASEGSSVGVTFVKTPSELTQAVENALKSDSTVLMEAQVKGREITVGILGNKALAVTEIIPKSTFYDYLSKYTPGKTVEITPADIRRELTEKAMRLAERAHVSLGLSNFSRIDMMIEDKTDMIYVLEANTVPGMTKTSLLPLAAEYRGIDFTELCRRMAR